MARELYDTIGQLGSLELARTLNDTHSRRGISHMNFGFSGAPLLLLLLPVVVWLVVLYLLVRFLRAFERGVYAHERIADALTKQFAGSRSRPDGQTI